MSERDIFMAAFQEPDPAARRALLDRACRADSTLRDRVEALLKKAAAAGSFLELPAAFADTPSPDAAPTATLPGEPGASPEVSPAARIGPYRLVRPIGEGGMGTVYLAEQQEPVRRQVALKIIRPGLDSHSVITRFEAERQALALMDHPNIARVLDAGTTPDGRPYFVMELVDGVPLTQSCDDARLPVRERLELFVSVCRAVQHAHQKGIIHRDLKPSNILVAEYDGVPTPKVIDFGVAKATDQRLTGQTLTGIGTVVGTPEYMSPEQAEPGQVDVDTRSDVYSLGVVLYELLTGTTPLERDRVREAPLLDVLRLIREEEPSTPSARLGTTAGLPAIAAHRGLEPKKLPCVVRGELDWIVMKCLEKDRARRYETASALAADLERYLNDEPVVAGPPSAGYRVRKFVRRNRRALATVAVLGLAILVSVVAVAGSVGWTMRDAEARRVRQLELAREEMRHELDWSDRLLAGGRRLEAVAAWERADRLDSEADADTELRGRLADLKRRLDEAARDELFVERSEAIRLFDETGLDEQNSRFDRLGGGPKLRELLAWYGLEPVVCPPADVAAVLQSRPAPVRTAILDALYRLNNIYGSAGAPPADVPVSDWASAVLDLADADPWRRQVMRSVRARQGATVERVARTVVVEDHPTEFLFGIANRLFARSDLTPLLCITARSPVHLSLAPLAGRRWEAGLDLHRRIQRARPDDFWANEYLGLNLNRAGRPAEALPYLTAAVALRPNNAGARHNRALALDRLGDREAALAELRRAIDLAPTYPAPHRGIGSILCESGDYRGAVEAYRRAIELGEPGAAVYLFLGQCYRLANDPDRALDSLNRAAAADPLSAGPHREIGKILQARKDYQGAIEAFGRAIKLGGPTAAMEIHLGNALKQAGEVTNATGAYRRAVTLDSDSAVAHFNLADSLTAKADLDEKILHYRRALECGLDYPRAHSLLGDALRTKGDHPAAIDSYRRAIGLGYKPATTFHNMGLCLYAKGNVEDAAAAFQEAVAIDPDDALVLSNLGELLRQLGDLPGSERALVRAVELDRKAVKAHSRLGATYRAQGKLDDAIDAYQKAIKINSRYHDAHTGLGFALAARGKWGEAISEFKTAVDLRPNDPQSLHDLGTALSVCPDAGLRDPKLAATLAQKMSDVGARSAGRTVLGLAQYREQQFRACIKLLEDAVAPRKAPPAGDPSQWLVLAMAHWQIGNKDRARELYEQSATWISQHKQVPEFIRPLQAEAAQLLGMNNH